MHRVCSILDTNVADCPASSEQFVVHTLIRQNAPMAQRITGFQIYRQLGSLASGVPVRHLMPGNPCSSELSIRQSLSVRISKLSTALFIVAMRSKRLHCALQIPTSR
jgi:hypothetical protein